MHLEGDFWCFYDRSKACLKEDGCLKSGEVRGVWFDQRAAHRVEAWLWIWIGEGWILLEGKKPKVTASLGTAGVGRNKHCPLCPNP